MRSTGSGSLVAQTMIAFSGMLGSGLAGLLLHVVLGGQGRDPTVGAGLAALLLAFLAAWLCGYRRYRALALVAALALALCLQVAAIGLIAYGGLPRLDRFFLSWFTGLGLLVAVPWLLGMGLGVGWRRVRPELPR